MRAGRVGPPEILRVPLRQGAGQFHSVHAGHVVIRKHQIGPPSFIHRLQGLSKYDALTDKLTTPTMINYTSMYGKTCGSTTDDYANKWLWAFRRQQSNDRENHPAAVKSLETAISSADGAYAVVYEHVDNNTHFL